MTRAQAISLSVRSLHIKACWKYVNPSYKILQEEQKRAPVTKFLGKPSMIMFQKLLQVKCKIYIESTGKRKGNCVTSLPNKQN